MKDKTEYGRFGPEQHQAKYLTLKEKEIMTSGTKKSVIEKTKTIKALLEDFKNDVTDEAEFDDLINILDDIRNEIDNIEEILEEDYE